MVEARKGFYEKAKNVNKNNRILKGLKFTGWGDQLLAPQARRSSLCYSARLLVGKAVTKLLRFSLRPQHNIHFKSLLGKGAQMKIRKKSGLLPNRGGVSEGSKMPNLYFGKVFFQLACRIILGPPKHVLHLV